MCGCPVNNNSWISFNNFWMSVDNFWMFVNNFWIISQQFLDIKSTIVDANNLLYSQQAKSYYSKQTRAGFQLYQTWLFWFYDSWWPHYNGIPCLARKCASNLIIVRDMYMCVGVNDTWNAYHVLHCFTKCSLQVLEWLPAWDSQLYQQVTLVH